MASTIQLRTGTGSAVPSSLTQGEVAINIDNGLIYYGSGSGNDVKQLESFTHITASGNINASGTIISNNKNVVSQSGAFTSNEFIVAVGNGAVTSSDALAVDSDGNLGIGTPNPEVRLHMLGEDAQTTQILMEQFNNTTDAPDIRTRRYRGTSASRADVQTGDYLFRLNVHGQDDGSSEVYGSMRFDVDSLDQDALEWGLQTRDTAGTVADRIKINSSGDSEFTSNITASGAISASGTITSAGLIATKDTDGGNTTIQIINSNTDGGVDKGAGIEFKHGSALGALSGNQRAGKILSTKVSSYQGTTAAVDSNLEFYTANNDTDTLQLKIDNEGLAAFTGDVSSSGKVYSTNINSIQFGFQSVGSAVQGTWYGPNNLGPNNTFWATTYGTAAAPGDVGLNNGNSGWFAPTKAFVTDAKLYIQNITNTTNYAVTGALTLTNTISYPADAGGDFNTTTDYTGDLYSTTGVQRAMEEVTITVGQAVEPGVVMYPRFNVNGTTANWRGTFVVNYYEIK